MFQLQKYLPGENKNEYDLERADQISLKSKMIFCLLYLSKKYTNLIFELKLFKDKSFNMQLQNTYNIVYTK